MMKTISIKVFGRVQGVGFRYFVQEQARQLGARGDVKNLADGSVHIRAQAGNEMMQSFIDAVKRGPAFSNVERVEIQDLTGNFDFDDFKITI